MKDGNPLPDLPIKQSKTVLGFQTSPSKLHPRSNPSPEILPEVGLEHPPGLIPARPVLGTGAQSLRRARLAFIRPISLSVPRLVPKTHGRQQ